MKGFIFFLLSVLGLVTSQKRQKLFKAKFTDCGSLLKIAPALEGSVKMSSPYGWKIGRHILQPGKTVKICINGTVLPDSVPLPVTGAGLKNSAHGKIDFGPLSLPVPIDFCDLQLDGCPGATPGCGSINYGDSVQFCSSLQVPPSPNVDVEVTWKVLREEVSDPSCEKEYDISRLKEKGKLPLVCIKIPAKVKN